jgi:D-alanyl-D-alanine carboxypeptidase
MRLAVLLLSGVVLACTTQAPATPTPLPTAAPTPTLQASASPSPPPTPSPTATPTSAATPTPSASSSAPAVPLAVLLGSELSNTLAQQQTDNGIPGISAELIFPDGSTWSDADGLAQLDPPVAATPSTLYVVGSMTKTFVTTLVMQLVEQGKMGLDDPLANWLPDYPNAANITIGELLSHTSGVHDFFENSSYTQLVIRDPLRVWTPQETLDSLVGPPYFDPGTGYHYSSTNFILLGLVLEQATGKQMGALLRQRLFKPLGLDHTYFQDAAHAPPAGAALGHSATTGADITDGTTYRPTTSEATVAWSAGAILSDVGDIATWCRALYGGQLLAPDSLAQMENYDYSPYSEETYGLGTRTRLFDGERMFGHTGSLRGFYGAMWYYPDSQLTVVVLDNQGRIDPNPIADALAALGLPAANAYLGR